MLEAIGKELPPDIEPGKRIFVGNNEGRRDLFAEPSKFVSSAAFRMPHDEVDAAISKPLGGINQPFEDKGGVAQTRMRNRRTQEEEDYDRSLDFVHECDSGFERRIVKRTLRRIQ